MYHGTFEMYHSKLKYTMVHYIITYFSIFQMYHGTYKCTMVQLKCKLESGSLRVDFGRSPQVFNHCKNPTQNLTHNYSKLICWKHVNKNILQHVIFVYFILKHKYSFLCFRQTINCKWRFPSWISMNGYNIYLLNHISVYNPYISFRLKSPNIRNIRLENTLL